MRGPVSQTTGPSSIGKLLVHFLLIEIRHGNSHVAGPEKELHPWEATQLRSPSRGEPFHLEQLQGKKELRVTDELVRGLAGGQQNAVGEVDVDACHGEAQDSTESSALPTAGTVSNHPSPLAAARAMCKRPADHEARIQVMEGVP